MLSQLNPFVLCPISAQVFLLNPEECASKLKTRANFENLVQSLYHNLPDFRAAI